MRPYLCCILKRDGPRGGPIKNRPLTPILKNLTLRVFVVRDVEGGESS